jgi:hypothetical protein
VGDVIGTGFCCRFGRGDVGIGASVEPARSWSDKGRKSERR